MNSKTITKIFLPVITIILLQSCFSYTRTEKDLHTITERDTTYKHQAYNTPGNRDGGTISPSTRDILHERVMVQIDSTVIRKYPDWIRFGLFESVGVIGGDSDFSLGNGMFGMHPNPFAALADTTTSESGTIFSGGIYRLGIFEDRLRWFRDDPNWTLGFNALEIIAPDAHFENTLIGFLTPYVKKRWYFREKIPYVSVAAQVGISPWGFMSQSFSGYLNTSASLEIGSIGGLNFRAYLGYAFGNNPKYSAQIFKNESIADDKVAELKSSGNIVSFPYFGLGVSFADFVNIVPELYTEYEDMEQSAWNIGIAQVSLLYTSTEHSFLDAANIVNLDLKILSALSKGETQKAAEYQNELDDIKSKKSIIKGVYGRLLPVSLALPILEDYKFYAGTSLMTGMLFGSKEAAIGFLPIRIGWWHTLIEDELTVEPFAEYLYYPSSAFNLGARLNLRMFESFNFGIITGYASGNMFGSDGLKGGPVDLDIFEDFGEFSVFYFGLSIGIKDRIFFPDELRYKK